MDGWTAEVPDELPDELPPATIFRMKCRISEDFSAISPVTEISAQIEEEISFIL